MSPSPSNCGTSGFVYPDPSYYGLNAPRWQSQTHNSTVDLGLTPATSVLAMTTAPVPSALDPALLAQGPATVPVTALAPAATSASITGPIPATRLSAAGLQPFPVQSPGLQAPIELTNMADIRLWNEQLLVSFDNSRMGLRNNRQDTKPKSQVSRQSRARGKLRELWEQAGGERYVKKQYRTAK